MDKPMRWPADFPGKHDKQEANMKLKPCPKCGCPDEVYIDSSSQAEASWIECAYCEHRIQAKVDEETLAQRWNKLDRSGMPEFVEGN